MEFLIMQIMLWTNRILILIVVICVYFALRLLKVTWLDISPMEHIRWRNITRPALLPPFRTACCAHIIVLCGTNLKQVCIYRFKKSFWIQCMFIIHFFQLLCPLWVLRCYYITDLIMSIIGKWAGIFFLA